MTVVPPPRTRLARLLPATVCAAAALLAACHTSHPPPPGTPVVTMSDLTNSSDFTSYILNIDALELIRNDGTVATPLVTPETVDLARLNSLTELVAAPALPEGTYISGQIVLDYTYTPRVWLNNNGYPLAASTANPNAYPTSFLLQPTLSKSAATTRKVKRVTPSTIPATTS